MDVMCKDLELEKTVVAATFKGWLPLSHIAWSTCYLFLPTQTLILFRTQEAWSSSSFDYTAE